MNIGIVSCVKQKQEHRAPAEELYISDWFQKTKNYVKQNYDNWYIISAKHHLLDPKEIIDPYDESLYDMKADERKNWSRIVYNQIYKKFLNPDSIRFFIFAGIKYRQYLLPLLDEASYTYNIPLNGLGIGKQLQWLKNNIIDKNEI